MTVKHLCKYTFLITMTMIYLQRNIFTLNGYGKHIKRQIHENKLKRYLGSGDNSLETIKLYRPLKNRQNKDLNDK